MEWTFILIFYIVFYSHVSRTIESVNLSNHWRLYAIQMSITRKVKKKPTYFRPSISNY